MAEAGASMQWKGTSVCMDFTCGCGAAWHVDGEFCYYVKCLDCGRYYKLEDEITLTEVPKPDSEAVLEGV